VQHRELAEELVALEGAPHSVTGAPDGGAVGDVRAVQQHAAPVGAADAGDHVEQRCLSRAVGADETTYPGGVEGETHLGEGPDSAEADGDVLALPRGTPTAGFAS